MELTKELVVKLIESKPLNGKINPIQLGKIRTYYREIYNDNNAIYKTPKRRKYSTRHKDCYGCLMTQLDALRIYAGYPSLIKRLDKKLVKKRIEKCNKCKYHQGRGILLTCGTPIIGNTVIEIIDGKEKKIKLCGCFMTAKAQFQNLYCPASKW